MKIAINTLPLSSGHKNRGIGIYTKNLIENLTKFDKKNQYVFFKSRLNQPADLIHYPFFDPFFLTLPIIKLHPTVVTVHDLTPIVFPKYYPRGIKGEIKWQIQKFSLKSSSAIITDSQNSKKDIAEIINFQDKKIYVVYLAPDEQFLPLPEGDWIAKTKAKFNLLGNFILYVGDVNYNKNLPGLFEAFSLLSKDKELDLVLVGEAFKNSLVFNKNQIPQNARILGFVEKQDLINLYNLAKLLCLPSFYEGFGLPVLEALSCGCQVVTSDNSSLPEIGGGAVFYCDPENPQDIALKMKEAIDNPLDKKVLLAKASSFSWEKTIQDTVKVYENIL